MNRFAAIGLLFDAYEGKRIMVLTPRWTDVRDTLSTLANSPAAASATVRRSSGEEGVSFPSGGRIEVRCVRSVAQGGIRGLKLDIAFIDGDGDRDLTGHERDAFYTDLQIATRNGEIVRA